MSFKYGWGLCSRCGADCGATKNGLAARHGFLRVPRGFRRTNLPQLASGHDHHGCAGSGKALRNWFNKKDIQRCGGA